MKILIDNGHGIDTLGKRSPYSASGVMPAIPFFEYKWNVEEIPAFHSRMLIGFDDTSHGVKCIVNQSYGS